MLKSLLTNCAVSITKIQISILCSFYLIRGILAAWKQGNLFKKRKKILKQVKNRRWKEYGFRDQDFKYIWRKIQVFYITIFNIIIYTGIHFISFRKCMVLFLEEKEITWILNLKLEWTSRKILIWNILDNDCRSKYIFNSMIFLLCAL